MTRFTHCSCVRYVARAKTHLSLIAFAMALTASATVIAQAFAPNKAQGSITVNETKTERQHAHALTRPAGAKDLVKTTVNLLVPRSLVFGGY